MNAAQPSTHAETHAETQAGTQAEAHAGTQAETQAQPEDRTIEELAGALDAATAGLDHLDAPARAAAQAMVSALDDAHRAALVRIVRGLRADPRGKELLFDLVDDPAVRLVLLMHGLIKAPAPARPPVAPPPVALPLIQLGRRPSAAEPGWTEAGAAEAFAPGTVTPVTVGDLDAIVVNVDGQFAAYVNQCAHLAMPLDDAALDAAAGTLTCDWHGYEYDALTGDCRSLPGLRLSPLPVRVSDGRVQVRARVP